MMNQTHFSMTRITKILIANRGEIAVRIIKTAHLLNIKTVAVYSEADRLAPHVRLANEAVLLGPPPSSESYLIEEKIIEAAKATGANAIHPGYGFLSENAGFAKKVADNNLIFIGPSPEAIEVMGSKLAAKHAVSKYDIPMVPGTDKAIQDPEEAKVIAKKIGFPILIKASAGGGGKGMRVVNNEGELEENMARAISEAESSFGDGSVFIEKYITSPKHIEIQVLGDQHGNVIHLFERECSVQRRHQKVVEEAPSPVVSEEMRNRMGQDAINTAKACGYYGAGTVEFIVDEAMNYYFLEMNTRLQVEHPVTEEISGVDLVEQQILVAQGEALQIKQEDLTINGHALELRLYAEDAEDNFMPDTGTLNVYKRPSGPGVRVDDGFDEGMEVPIYYDPMIAKLIVHGSNRTEAINKMIQAINDYKIEGIKTTLSFGKFVFEHPEFQNGSFTTKFVESHFSPEKLKLGKQNEKLAAAIAAAMFFEKDNAIPKISNDENLGWNSRMQ